MLKNFICVGIIISLLFTGCGQIKGKDQSATTSPAGTLPTYAPKEENTEILQSEMSADKQYSDNRRTISFYGLKEYKKFTNGKITDTPKKGNKYLVLFLRIENKDSDNFYFHEAYLESKIDKKEIDHTAIFNDPEYKYVTAFSNVPAGYALYGFVVWEVPKDWKKLDLKYTALEQAEGISLQMHFSKKDLKKPSDISQLEVQDGLEYVADEN